MTGERRAETDEVAAAQLVERAQQMMLVAKPACVFRDDGGAIAVRADAERIAPLAAAADSDGPAGAPALCLLRTLHIAHRLLIPRVAADWRAGAVQASWVTHRRQTMRERLAR
jgi:hypothetical protein